MAKRISDLPELPLSDSNDLIPIVDVSGNVTKRVTTAGLSSAVAANLPVGSVAPAAIAGGVYGARITLSAGAGSKTLSGFGFKPKEVTFIQANSNTAATVLCNGYAVYNGTTISQGSTYTSGTGTARQTGTSSGSALVIADPSSGSPNLFAANVTSFDDDGITLNVGTDNSSYRSWHVIARG